MNIPYFSTKKFVFAALFAGLLFLGTIPFSAHAQTYYYQTTYGQNSNNPQIQSLLNQIYVLLAQIKTLQNTQTTYTVTQPHYVVPVNYQPVTSYTNVYGNYQYNNYNVGVSTNNPQYNGSSVTFNGSVTLNGAPYAHVWFEYGQNGNITQQTGSTQISANGPFSATVSLYSGDRYYYRAVVEDPSGTRHYGTLVSVNNNNYNNCNYYNNYNNCNYNSNCYYYNNCNNNNNNYNTPDASTDSAQGVSVHSAQLRGSVSMNGYNNGVVFFVYGQNRNSVQDADSYDRYSSIPQNGQNLQKVQVDSNLDGYRSYWTDQYGLDSNARYYYSICVQYDGNSIECGGISQFDTDLY